MKKYNFLYIVLLAILFTACEKVINVDLENAEPRIVIEGIINNTGTAAKVTISKSVSFSASNTYPPVTGATVSITDDRGNVYPLTEATPGTYTNALLTGATGSSYSLKVNAEGKIYTSSCKMPEQVNLDTIYQDRITIAQAIIFINAQFDDPAGFGNYYHFIETINGKRNATIFLIDDNFTDGGTVANQLVDETSKLKRGDRVEVEMQCISKEVYRYLRGLQDLQFNNTVPANPESNISNNALGYFSAHTAQKKTIVIQ
jgi:Domain of unknown function (DUF4249)